MKTLLIIILVAAIIAGAVWVGTKFFGLAKDEDKDGIPDKVEDAVDTVKSTAKEVKRRAQRVKEEIGDVVEELKEAVDQAKDVKNAVKGKPRRGRKPYNK
jgi:hypothetical protein